MRFIGIEPRRGAPPQMSHRAEEGDALNSQITAAVETHKCATEGIVTSSLNQVQRAEDVKVAIKSLVKRLDDYNDATLRTAQGALDLVSMRARDKR